MGSAFSDWANIVKGIPQGSIPDLLLFNIVSIDLLFFSESFEFCYFADENLSFFSGRNSTWLLPVNLGVLPKSRYAKSL